MGNHLDHFEEAVRQSLDGVKFDYEPQQWAEMESMLNRAGQSGRRNTSLLAAAGFLLVSVSAFTLWPNNSSEAFRGAQAEPMPRTAFGYDTAESADAGADALTTTDFASEAEATLAQANQAATPASNAGTTANHSANTTAGSDRAQEVADATSSDADTSTDNNGTADTNLPADDAPAILLSVSAACAGEPIDFSVNMDLEGMQYLWIFGDGDFSSDPAPTHLYEKAGVWEAALSIQDPNGKIIAESLGAKVRVHQKPEARFNWDFVNRPGEVTRVKFNNTSKYASESVWTFDTGESTSEINPELEYFQPGAKRVSLETTNEFGCTDQHTEILYVQKDYDLEAPLAIAPANGETFMPDALQKDPRAFSLTVYHEMQPVFVSNSYSEGWDGTLSGGQAAAPGTVCSWVLVIYGRDGLEKEYYSGEITVTAP